uniref:Venom peptide U11-SYTX-Sth1a n=1 Tax=Scytodes thoracica TaxID=1112478 RepID=A0A0A0V5S8_SCYTH|nr:venom peptide U11-SYTX-Sth1a [Scytodes thoracica]
MRGILTFTVFIVFLVCMMDEAEASDYCNTECDRTTCGKVSCACGVHLDVCGCCSVCNLCPGDKCNVYDSYCGSGSKCKFPSENSLDGVCE